MGGVNNVAAGNANVTQSNSGQVNAGDLDSLLDYLRGPGIPPSTTGDLERDLKSDSGKKVVAEGWLGKLAKGIRALRHARQRGQHCRTQE